MIPPQRRRARPVQVAGGGYCYGGPHPAPGGGWEAITTPHTHNYAPFDLRLFSQHEGCYYFIGDPRDFGYTGQVYNYYGAHPIADAYGGGWCFMVGGHYHWWRPWSPYFTVVGPWFYWDGAYDPFFWSYWPYYSFYYRSYYPSYYAGGRYYRNGYRVAPPITRVPPTGWRGTPPGGRWRDRWRRDAAGGWRGTPPGDAELAAALRRSRGRRLARRARWRSAPGTARPAVPGAEVRRPPGGGLARRRAAAPAVAPSGGGWHGGAPSGGGWHGAAAAGARAAGGWHTGGRAAAVSARQRAKCGRRLPRRRLRAAATAKQRRASTFGPASGSVVSVGEERVVVGELHVAVERDRQEQVHDE